MNSPFYAFLETHYRMHLLEDRFTKGEWVSLGRFQKTNNVTDLPVAIINKLRKKFAEDHLDVAEFDKHLARFYVATNLRKYEQRVASHFNPRSMDMWSREARSMSEDKLSLFYNITGVEATSRPGTASEAPTRGKKGKDVIDAGATIESCFKTLQDTLTTDAMKPLIEAYTESVEIDMKEHSVIFHHGEDFIEISTERSTNNDMYSLYTNGGYQGRYPSAETAMSVALKEMKEIVQGKLREMSARKPIPNHAHSAEVKLIRELKNTDWEGQPNFKRWQKTPDGIKFFDEVDAFRFRIYVDETKPFPYLVLDIDDAGDQVFNDPVDAIKFVMSLLLIEDDEMAEPEEIEETVLAMLTGTLKERKKKSQVGKKKPREILDEDDDDDDENKVSSLFTTHALTRCPSLAKFDELRQDYFDESGADTDNVSTLFHELEVIGTHPFTRVMAEYWTESFVFELIEDMEEAPEYKLSCADFSLVIYPNVINLLEHRGDGHSLSYERMTGDLSLSSKLDLALNYFGTWDFARTRDTLERIGFSVGPISDDEEPVNLRNDQYSVVVEKNNAAPNIFFGPVDDDTAPTQLIVGDDHVILSEFLREGIGQVRGVIFNEDESNQGIYGLTIFGELDLRLHAVSARNMSVILLVAESESAENFMNAIEGSGEFTLDDLRNKGMIVETDRERTTLKFKYDDDKYVVHIYE